MDAQHSSIFNFDRIRTLRTVPVGTWIWFGFLASAMVVSTWAARIVVERIHPTPRTAAVRALGPRTDVLVSGSSRVLRGIEPALYSTEVVNLSSGGFGYQLIEAIIMKALRRAPNVKLVALEMDSFPIHRDGFASLWDTGQLYESGLSPRDFPAPWRRRILRMLTQPPVFLASRVTPKSLLERDTNLIWRARSGFEPFWGNRNLAEDPDYAGHGPEKFIEIHEGWKDKPDPCGNVPALIRLCRELNSRGIGILLFRLPHLDVWRNGINPKWDQQVQAAVRDILAQVQDGVWFLDLADTPGFDLWLFTDGLHYNDEGIRRLAIILDPIFTESCSWAEYARQIHSGLNSP